jgi:hypothetical protein
MKKIFLIATSLTLAPVSQAVAHFPAIGPSTPDRIERVACRIVHRRIDGAVTTRQVCDNAPAVESDCRLVTRRIIKAGGEAVIRTRRQCN